MKNHLLKQVILTACFFIGTIVSLSAAIDGKTYTKYVCDNSANNTVDLSLDVVKNGFTPDGGHWDLVVNEVTDPSTYDPSTQQIEGDVSNVFVMSGKKTGIYKYVFTATRRNACIPLDSKVLAVVVILETPKPFSQKITLCENETYSVDLNEFVSSTLPTGRTYTLQSSPTGVTLAGSTLSVDGTYEGDIVIKYTVTQNDINNQEINVCNEEASIIISVNRDGSAPKYTGPANITSCIDELPTTINLNNLLATRAASGSWSVVTTGTGAPTINNGTVTFANPAANDVYTFTYEYQASSCYPAGSLQFTYTLSDDLSASFADNSKVLCKQDDPTGVIDMLRDGLEIDIPLSAGSWIATAEATEMDVTDGLFELMDAAPGDYQYLFKVSSAAEICGLAGESALLDLTVIDTSNAQDGRVEFCVADVNNNPSNTIELSDYVSNLPAGTAWTSTEFTSISGGQLNYSDLSNAGVGTHKLAYSYTAGECGEATGNLFITVTDEIDMADTYSLKYCRPDMPASINLNQAIGIGAEGTWTAAPSSATTYQLNENVFTEQDNVTGTHTYIFNFTPTSTECGVQATTVTIIVTDEEFTN